MPTEEWRLNRVTIDEAIVAGIASIERRVGTQPAR